MEIYSRKGRDGRAVDFVLAEAERRPDACLHVSAPMPPEVVFGVDVGQVRSLHDERAAAATTTTKAGKTRRIRSDQNTLVTVVASHPATMAQTIADPSIARAVRDWEALTVEWLRKQYGPALVSVVRHTDESHPHLHAFILPDQPDMRAGRLHPGQEAKAGIVGAGTAEGEDGKALNKRGDVAYRAAMREWQDSYWQEVGLPCGLTRLGPGRRRLTRAEWHAEKLQSLAVRRASERVETLKESGSAFIARTRTEATVTIQQAQTEADEIRSAALASQKAAFRLHDAAEARFRNARSMLSQARRQAKRILAAARTDATRLRAFGARIRSLWDGLRSSSVEARIRATVAGEVDVERDRANIACRRADSEASKRRNAERAREATIAAAHALGRERDAARRQLAALRADVHEVIQHHSPGGSR